MIPREILKKIRQIELRTNRLVSETLGGLSTVELSDIGEDNVAGEVRQSDTRFPEEQRSRQPSIFSVLRALNDLFGSPEDEHLGFYGAFGYDLVFQFEPMRLRLPRPEDQRDLVLYLPDEILIVDHMRQHSAVHRYEFEVAGQSTHGLPRATPPAPYHAEADAPLPPDSDHGPGEYAGLVRRAKEAFVRGDLFEVVCGQLFSTRCADPPSTVFSVVTGYLNLVNQRLQTVSRIYIDETGLGGFFVQDAIKSGLKNAHGVFLSLPKKQEIMDSFKRLMQDGHLHFRRDPELTNEMSAERFQLSKTGQLQFSHPAGTHDDRLWAFALAVNASRFETPTYHPVAAIGRNPNSLMPNIDRRLLIPGANTPRPGDPPGVIIHGQLWCWACGKAVITRPHICDKQPTINGN